MDEDPYEPRWGRKVRRLDSQENQDSQRTIIRRPVPPRSSIKREPQTIHREIPVNRVVAPRPPVSSSWVRRHAFRLGLVGMILFFCLTGYVLLRVSVPASSTGSQDPLSLIFFQAPQTIAKKGNPLASQKIVAHTRDERNQFYTPQEQTDWGPSACSGFSYMAVLNAYGHYDHAHIASDVLQVELNMGIWRAFGSNGKNPGLDISPQNMNKIAQFYGFQGNFSSNRSLDKVIAIANSGYPVIVVVAGWADTYDGHLYFNHVFVVRGGDGANVFLVDSWLNLKYMSRTSFLSIWSGGSDISFVMWPPDVVAPQL